MIIKEGRFGAYVTDGEINATLRRGDDIETITAERAAELLAEKRAKGPAPKKRPAKRPTSGGCRGHLVSETGREESGGEEGTRQNWLTPPGRSVGIARVEKERADTLRLRVRRSRRTQRRCANAQSVSIMVVIATTDPDKTALVFDHG